MGTARIATLNLFGRQGVWEERRSVLLDGLRELRPDVVAFQDVVKVGGYDQAADLLGPGYHVAHQTDRAADGSGVSIASRWPLGEVQELDLRLTPRTSNLPYGVLVAEILASDQVGTLLVANQRTAFPFGGELERELQAVATARLVEELVEGCNLHHVVMASDLNAIPESASVRFWRGLQSLEGISVCYRDSDAQHSYALFPDIIDS